MTTATRLFAALLVVCTASTAIACPACPPVLTATLSERYALADVAVLAQLITSRESDPKKGTVAQSTYRVVEIALGAEKQLKRGSTVAINMAISGEKGDLFVLLASTKTRKKGRSRAGLDWDEPVDATETAWHYITQAPPPETPTARRLPYFLKFLEFPDALISDDAFAEFAKARFSDVAANADKFPRKKLHKWLTDPKTPQSRVGLYGLMLGLCGEEDDAKFLEKLVRDEKEYRTGLDGILFGYLLLTGEKGLRLIERTKLVADSKIPFNETYSAMQALRIYWSYGNGGIKKDRLRSAMRRLLEHRDLRELVLADLARWKDWSLQSELMKLYGTSGWKERSVRIAIIRYMLAGTKDRPKAAAAATPAHVLRAQKYLALLKTRDAKLVETVLRLPF